MLYRDYLKSKYQNTAVKLANAEGVPCVLEYSKGKNMRNYEVYANSVQDGTPSPESPVEIQSVGDLVTDTESEYYGKYDIPITVKGKNLFDKSISTNPGIRNETVITDNSYSIGILRLNEICEILKPNTTYTISCEIECESIPSDVTLYNILLGFSIYTPVSGYSTANALIKKQLSVGEIYYYSQTTTTPLKFDSGGNYRFLLYRNAYKDADGNYQFPAIICRNIQIEEGTSSTAYEPYKGSETTHIFLDEPLRKVGDYADYIDFKNQKVVRKIEVLDDTGTKTILESFGTLLIPTEENISLPALKTFKGTSIMSVDTAVLPSNIKAKYIRT